MMTLLPHMKMRRLKVTSQTTIYFLIVVTTATARMIRLKRMLLTLLLPTVIIIQMILVQMIRLELISAILSLMKVAITLRQIIPLERLSMIPFWTRTVITPIPHRLKWMIHLKLTPMTYFLLGPRYLPRGKKRDTGTYDDVGTYDVTGGYEDTGTYAETDYYDYGSDYYSVFGGDTDNDTVKDY